MIRFLQIFVYVINASTKKPKINAFLKCLKTKPFPLTYA